MSTWKIAVALALGAIGLFLIAWLLGRELKTSLAQDAAEA